MKFWSSALLAMLLSGCASDLGWSLMFASEKKVEVRELARANVCGTQQELSAVSLFADAAEVERWQQSRGLHLIDTGAMPAGPYALVEMGLRPSSGYGVVISRKAGIRKDMLVLSSTYFSPAEGSTQAQVETSPCVLMALPPDFYRAVVVMNQSGVVQASTLNKE
ncbi:MAG: protease complex subunit PrcB family protein [Nevskiaceae bacterium]|nr:MAG: protease complex subunit PrcB family protein [Nevskiaceae bacterium]